jgi:glycosyltransferase involved in cell wall biosynthesis
MKSKSAPRLLYVVHHGYPHSSDGYAVRTHGVARGLMDHGVEVLVCKEPGESTGVDISPASEGTEDCVEGVVYWHPAMRGFHGLSYADRHDAFSAMLQSKIRQFQPTAVLAASNWQVALPAMDAARREGLPFYYEVRGFWEITQLSRDASYRETEEFSVHVEQETRVCLSAAGVFTLGEAMREELVRRGVPRGKISMVPNGLCAWRPRRSIPAITKAQLGISSRYVAGYVGSFNSYEGLEDLVKAAAAIWKNGLNLSLLLVGGSGVAGIVPGVGATASCAATQSFQTLAEELGFADRLILPGRVPPDQAAAYYDAMDLVVIPRKPMEVSEIVPPLKPLEALAAGKRVLMSDVAPLKELAEKEPRFRCFEKGNLESLAREMENMLSDNSAKVIQACKPCLNRRDWSEMVKPIVQIIEPAVSISSNPGIISHDADWQYPAITEEHAYRRALESLPEVEGVVYLGFPWATLIDRLWYSKDARALLVALKNLSRRVKPGSRVVTVCQHIRLLDHMQLLAEAGITDVFWSHAARGQTSVLMHRGISIFPFPLYPAQVPPQESRPLHERSLLFSFVGARSEEGYLRRTREILFDTLGNHPRGVVRPREQWHYLEAVYGKQIAALPIPVENTEDHRAKEEEFRAVLARSVFSLCPSGSGPNTIRLWESLGAGAIPVVLSDSWQPPGEMALWEEAVVFCGENEREIARLPARLEALHRSPTLLEKKRMACRELWARYGPQGFITDILNFYGHLAGLPLERRSSDSCDKPGRATSEAQPVAPIVLAPDSFAQANTLHREGQYAEALRIYEALAAHEPLAIYRDNARMCALKLKHIN